MAGWKQILKLGRKAEEEFKKTEPVFEQAAHGAGHGGGKVPPNTPHTTAAPDAPNSPAGNGAGNSGTHKADPNVIASMQVAFKSFDKPELLKTERDLELQIKTLRGRVLKGNLIDDTVNKGVVRSAEDSIKALKEGRAISSQEGKLVEEHLVKGWHDYQKSLKASHVVEKLSDLTPGRFGRDQLDARLKTLGDTAKEQGLINPVLKREKDLTAKQIEDTLKKGEPVTPNELARLSEAKQKDFDGYEAKATKAAVAAKLKAEGKESAFSQAMKWPIRIIASTLTVAGIGVAANKLWLDGALDGKAASTVGSITTAITTNAEVSKDKAKQEAFAQLQRTCLSKGGEAGEITNQCIVPHFSDSLSSLSEVFGRAGATEPERVYVKKVAEGLQRAIDTSNGSIGAFNENADSIRIAAKRSVESDPRYKDNLPDFDSLDLSIERVLKHDQKFALNFDR